MKSSFQVIPILLTPSIKQGETIEINLFITGYGKITKHKLNVLPSSRKLIDEKESAFFSNVHKVKDPKPNEPKIIMGKAAQKPSEFQFSNSGTYINFSKHFFLDKKEIMKSPPIPEHGIPNISGEIEIEETPPIVIKLKTKTDAPRGDHKIDLVLTYAEGGNNDNNGGDDSGNNGDDDEHDDRTEFSTDHKVITVHVKTWLETDGWKWAVAGTLIALGSLVYPVLTQIFPCLLNTTLC